METSTVRFAPHRRRFLDIQFDGDIAERFAPSFRWQRQGDDDQLSSAFRAFAVNFPGFEAYLYECDRIGMRVAVILDGQPLDDFLMMCALGSAKSCQVIQIPAGAGGNLFKGILGVGLLATGLLTMGGSIGVGGAILGISGKSLAITGGLMAVSALGGALASRPMISSKSSKDGTDPRSSYFSATSQDADSRILPALYGTSIYEYFNKNTGAFIGNYPIGHQTPTMRVSLTIKYSRLPDGED